jgi:nitrate reductase molybdenum cofactor assembly chaperone NarJ/NarW
MRPPAAVTGESAALTRMLVSRLLSYPDANLLSDLEDISRVIPSLPEASTTPLRNFVDALQRMEPDDLTTHYVDTFDLSRRCCLYLTYYAHGDTRKRGMALLRFKHAYRMAGMTPTEDELVDHLAVVLEFAATGDAKVGENLLKEHRPGLELLRLALEEINSPYSLLIDAINATLPPVQVRDRDEAIRLAQQGPPTEDVGLEPYMDPDLAERLTRA